MNVQLPDGTVLEGVPEGTTRAQLRAKLQANGYDVSKLGVDPPTTQAQPDEPVRTSLERVMSGIGQGAADLAAGFGKVGSTVLMPYDAGADILQGRTIGTANRERRASIRDFAREHGANDITATINQGAPELLATLAPMGAAGRVGALTDIGANAAYAAAQTGAEGGSLDDVVRSGALGGVGAAGGRLLTRALGGSQSVSKQARELMDKGVMPTPGQVYSGRTGDLARAAEDKATSLPIVGDIINHARRRSLAEFNRATVNEALAPLGGKPITATGSEAIEAAQRRISAAYGDALEGMSITPTDVKASMDAARMGFKGIALLDDNQFQRLANFIETRVMPEAQKGSMSGEVAKRLDSEMGHWARQFSRSVNPGDRPLGDAFYELQQHFRIAMQASAPAGKADALASANEAYRQLLPLARASGKAVAQGGTFTPFQAARAAQQIDKKPGTLVSSAQEVLPSRVPDSGTLGRYAAGALLGGSGALVAPGTTAIASALAGIAYSRTGTNLLINGLGGAIPPQAKARMLAMAPEKAVALMQRVAEKNPQFARHLAAQLGRMAMAQQPEEVTQ